MPQNSRGRAGVDFCWVWAGGLSQHPWCSHFDDARNRAKTTPMAKNKEQYFKQVADAGVVAVIRAQSKDQLTGITEALLEGGVPAIEVTMSTPKAIAGIEMLADQYGDRAVIGVGTVVDAATCRDAIAAGAQFVVSPVFDEQIVATT